jgi:hypothetical protein
MHKTITGTIVAIQLACGAAGVGAQSAHAASGARHPSDEPGFNVGIKGGLNFAGLSNEETFEGTRIGVVAGAWIARRLTGPMGLQLEALYSPKGSRDDDVTIAVDYLEIPFLVTLKPANSRRLRPIFFTGPAVEFKVRARYGDVPDESFQEGFNQFVHGSEFEWVTGGGLEAPYGARHLTLEARYAFGLTPVFDAEPNDSDSKKRNRVFAVLFGYRFN